MASVAKKLKYVICFVLKKLYCDGVTFCSCRSLPGTIFPIICVKGYTKVSNYPIILYIKSKLNKLVQKH